MTSLIERDYFTDYEILKDPYAYFEAIRERGPVYQPPGKDYLIVTGFEETLEVLRDHDTFSAIIGLQGAAMALPFTPEGSDITDQIEAHRLQFLGGDLVVNLDDDAHSNLRALVNTLFVPSRLKANEAFIAEYSDQMIREAVAKGEVDVIKTIATPFVTIVIADLLGVPVEDRQMFMDTIAMAPPPGNLDGDNDMSAEDHPFVIMGSYFAGYIADRSENPRDDVLTELATAILPNGVKPPMQDIVQLGMFMFGAGQDTSAKLLGNSIKYLVEDLDLQAQLRGDPKKIPAFIEEVLRIEGSTKQTARLARKDTEIAGVKIAAGTKILVALSAANRDPKRWENPAQLQLGRKRIIEHAAFGRGKHVCAGAPLARVEVRVLLEKLLSETSHFEIDRAKHPNGVADLSYEPSFIIRGLAELHLKLTPREGFVAPEKPAIAATLPTGQAFSTGSSSLETLLADPAAKAVLVKHFPDIGPGPFLGIANGFTLRGIAKVASRRFPAPALDALDADLLRLAQGVAIDRKVALSTGATRLGDLLGNPVAVAVLEKHFAGISTDKRIGMAKGMTLRAMKKFAPDQFTDEALDALDAELCNLA
ncbi:MAG: cytochrome P450 [Pseudomonas sp.]|uniref:cytochrome P450 n=1 Tax=Pseudomonas sp. TaxID=306 RepID=UPI001204EA7A|nr:cytochrome P450 [Pseudomonas sp.]RZI76950.1 MAG: cytochrome P450 [Pseudomonas sp.]